MSFPTTSWLLWQKEHRKASSDPARFTQFSPLPPWTEFGTRWRPRRPRRRELLSNSFLLSPEPVSLATCPAVSGVHPCASYSLDVRLPAHDSCGLSGVFEQEVQRLIGLDAIGNPP